MYVHRSTYAYVHRRVTYAYMAYDFAHFGEKTYDKYAHFENFAHSTCGMRRPGIWHGCRCSVHLLYLLRRCSTPSFLGFLPRLPGMTLEDIKAELTEGRNIARREQVAPRAGRVRGFNLVGGGGWFLPGGWVVPTRGGVGGSWVRPRVGVRGFHCFKLGGCPPRTFRCA